MPDTEIVRTGNGVWVRTLGSDERTWVPDRPAPSYLLVRAVLLCAVLCLIAYGLLVACQRASADPPLNGYEAEWAVPLDADLTVVFEAWATGGFWEDMWRHVWRGPFWHWPPPLIWERNLPDCPEGSPSP